MESDSQKAGEYFRMTTGCFVCHINMKKIINNKNIFTLPNAITLLRLLLIPLFIWLYLGKEAYVPAFLVYLAAGILDLLDGDIARRYNMISDFGKLFDPVVDKLTQVAIFFCLLSKFPNMLILLIVLIIKEIATGVIHLLAINKTNMVESAKWPGKLTSLSLNVTAMIHILWGGIPAEISNIIIGICIGFMLFSFIYYAIHNLRKLL